MALLIGDTVPDYPAFDDLKPGNVLKIPKLNCRVLALDSGARRLFPPVASDRTGILGTMQTPDPPGTPGIWVPEPFRTTDFGKKGFPLRVKLMRTYCPWFDHATVQYNVKIDYTESTTPVNGVNAPQVSTDYQWAANTTDTRSLTSGTPPPNFSSPWGGGVPQTSDLTLEPVQGLCDATIQATFTLTSSGSDGLAGMGVVQQRTQGCDGFHQGFALSVFWTWTHFLTGNPIGLVRTMTVTVRGSAIYT